MDHPEINARALPQHHHGGGSSDDEDYDLDGSNGGRGGGGKRMRYMKRDTSKIHTNPKYRCVDDGSEDENAVSKNNMNDDGQ